MLADAFAAERLRFFKARGTLFWSLCFVPIVSVLMGLLQGFTLRMVNIKASDQGTRDIDLIRTPIAFLEQAVDAVSGSNFFIMQLFFLIAGSAILAGDYRWETWRFLTPRNTRTNLLLAKLGVFGLAAAIGLALLAVGGIVGSLASAALTGGGVEWAKAGGNTNAQLLGIFGIAWLEMMTVGALAAVVAVATRTGLAALLAPVGVWIVQGFVLSQITRGFENPLQPPLQYLLAFPALQADMLKAALTPPDPGMAAVNWPMALAALLTWIAALTALAVWQFKRQDLTRE